MVNKSTTKLDEDKPTRSRNLPAAATTSTNTVKTLERKKMPARTGTDPRYVRFAAALFQIGDSTKAYFASHLLCKSSRQAKERGRALAKLPEVMLEMERLRMQSLDGTGESNAGLPVFSEGGGSASKVAWENELHLLAYSKVNIRKLRAADKLAALRILGESRGYIGPSRQPGQGIRAVFNFRLGGRLVGTGAVQPVAEGQAASADPNTGEGAIDEQAAEGDVGDAQAGVPVEGEPSSEPPDAGNT